MPDRVLVVAIILALVIAGSFALAGSRRPGEVGTIQSGSHAVPLDQIISGGPPPDGIPSIDHPQFISAANASWQAVGRGFLTDDYDWVIGISYNGDTRAYPLQIMVWHEIVNDVVGGVPLAITYCPLCYSTAAFVREINGTTVQFGTSGKLYNNNLVMYDRLTKSLWSQIWGEAISGSLQGHKLQRIPIDVMTWGQWKKLYPNTLVLSRQTGFNRDYGDDPYGAYYYTSGILFPLIHLDNRLFPKTIIVGLTLGNASKAYVLKNLTSNLFADTIGGNSVLLWKSGNATRFFDPEVGGTHLTFNSSNGTVTDSQTRSTWNFDGVATAGPLKGTALSRYVGETAFWFAWAAFYPDTQIYA